MPVLPDIKMSAFQYDLPDDRIAKYPLPERDLSKLLVWEKNGNIRHDQFRKLPDYFTGNELLFFNNTRVIPARLFFRKETGALIEVFMLAPVNPGIVDIAMQQTAQCDWSCTIGNLKSWKKDLVLERILEVQGHSVRLSAELLDAPTMQVRFSWEGGWPLVSVLEAAGQTPIPPYLQRPAEDSDRETYQTIYSKKDGAVAAPTAGLHFTPNIVEALREKGVQTEEVTLHVSAGTFKPVKTEDALSHDMHYEQVVVYARNITALLEGRPVVCVGTTALRTLESLYWFGVKLLENPDAEFNIEKEYSYSCVNFPDMHTSLQAIADMMERRGIQELHGITQLYIMPGYQFRMCKTLITNFHQPGSTLLLLVAAFTGGGDAWQQIYQTAMHNGYRFLSYGDSSLLRAV